MHHDIRIQPPRRRRNPKFVCVKQQSCQTHEIKPRRPGKRSGQTQCDSRPLLLLLANGRTTGRTTSEAGKDPAATRIQPMCLEDALSSESRAHAVFTWPQTRARAGHETSLDDGRNIEITPCVRGWSQDGAKPGMSNRTRAGTPPNTRKLTDTLLNNSRVKEKISKEVKEKPSDGMETKI